MSEVGAMRNVVEQVWDDMLRRVDQLLVAGRVPHGEVLIDMARFLECAMPAVRAGERALAHLGET
jgi:hypothetical protein